MSCAGARPLALVSDPRSPPQNDTLLDGYTDICHSDLHIDHIRPIASFDIRDEEEMREAFHFTNSRTHN